MPKYAHPAFPAYYIRDPGHGAAFDPALQSPITLGYAPAVMRPVIQAPAQEQLMAPRHTAPPVRLVYTRSRL